MDVREEILDYINRNELTGALLLTGPWGCGKTYLVKEIAKELNNGKKVAVSTISLFGIDSVAAINKRVKDEYTGFILGSLGKTAKKLSKAVTTVAKDGMTVASIAAEGMPGLSAASHGLSSIMDYDLFGFIEVKNTIGKDNNKRKFILVFDDLERSNLKKKNLLGVLNEYVENKQIRVIIVADEEKIESDDYKEYKEKLITRTIRMAADYGTLIDQIVEAYSETSTGYKAFLEENRELIKQVFLESKSFNLRTLKSALADFERIYAAWQETDIATDNMKWALYTFAAELFISKVPQKKEAETPRRNNSFSLVVEEDKQYVYKGKNQSSFSAFTRWICKGAWDKSAFIQELQNKYSQMERSPLERFLLYHFWSLEQKDVDEGMLAAIELAYKGELSRENLISVLTKIHVLKEYSIELPCEVSYEKMEEGFKLRLERIKQGAVSEPRCHTFAEGSQIDEDAHHLYKQIEKLEDQMIAWENRRLYISFLNGGIAESGYFRRGLYIDEFDDELLEIFKKEYTKASNEEKREFARSLLGLAFDYSSCSSEENMSQSCANFRRLIEWLNSQDSDDGITKIINKSFAEQIQESNLLKRALKLQNSSN